MKIGFDAKRLYCNFTGLGNYGRAVLRDLQQFFPEQTYHLYTPSIQHTPETEHFLQHESYRTYQYAGQFEWLWRSYSMVRQLQADRIDLYHGLSHELPANIHRSGIRSVVTIHDLIFEIYPRTYSALDRQIYHWKFERACRIADKIVAISQSTKQDIVRYYGISPDKIEVVYQSCHPLFYEAIEAVPEDSALSDRLPREYLLYVGSITERKNLKIVVEAYEQLSPTERIPWVIIGQGKKHQKKLAKLIEAKGLRRWVIWIDDLTDNDQLTTVYRRAAALIYPSLYEGFGLPVVEALLCRTPVITSRTSSLPEAGGPHSVYVDPQRADEVAEAIRQVLQDSERRETMKQKGYCYATEKFSRQAVAKRMMSVYDSVLTSSR